MAVLLANNATSRLASSLTAAATTLSVTTGEGAKFPIPTGGDWFPLTLIKSSGALEILRCTARSGDVFTVTRAQEGTAAQAFSAGDRVEVRITKAVMDAIVQQINDLTNSALLDANNLSDLTNPATARTNLQLGSAATASVTASSTDTTAGRLLKVGDFGLGAELEVTNCDTVSAPGMFSVAAGATGWPFGSTSGGVLLHGSHAGGVYASQVALSVISAVIKKRVKISGVWQAWQTVYTSAEVSAFAATLLDDADAAAARATLDVYSKAEANGIANGIAIGVGQTWQDVTASRAVGTTYTNSTGRPIQIFVTFDPIGTGSHFQIDGVDVLPSNDTSYYHVSCVIPAGATYRLVNNGGGIAIKWVELR